MAAFHLHTLGLLVVAAEASVNPFGDSANQTNVGGHAPFKTKRPRLIKQDAECGSMDRYMENSNSYIQCAQRVAKSGGHYFSFGKVDPSKPTPPPTSRIATSAEVQDSLQVKAMQSAAMMMRVGSCYMEYNYQDSCPKGFKVGAFDFFALDDYEVHEERIKESMECKAKEHYLGKFKTVKECAKAVLDSPDGQFFNYGRDDASILRKGLCYLKTTDHTCKEGFKEADYDFWGLKFDMVRNAEESASRRRNRRRVRTGANSGSGGYVGNVGAVKYKTVKKDSECESSDKYLGWYTTKEGCARAVKERGGKFAAYGTGTKMWLCYEEETATADCKEGFESDSFDFIEIVV